MTLNGKKAKWVLKGPVTARANVAEVGEGAGWTVATTWEKPEEETDPKKCIQGKIVAGNDVREAFDSAIDTLGRRNVRPSQ